MRPEVSGDHSEVHGVQGGTPESPRSLLQTAIGDLGDKSAVEKLDEQHAANTKAIEELDTLLNKHLKEHPEISSSQKPLDDLKKDHETLAEMLGDDEMRAELLSDHDSRMAFQTDVDSISDRAGELKGAIEQKLPASTERLPDQHDDATASAASDDSLARQAERSGFGDIDARRLERISKALDLTENAGPQTKDIHNALSEIKAELSTAFADRRAGHGIEPASLSEHIQKITMYSDRLLSSEQTLQSLPQEELKQKAERLRGLSAELHCANDVARSGEAASFIVLGVEGYKGDG
ncbi:MAG: hypothetical protein J2P37_29645, partial [Ktedonobacteraceae bacterium]|nr:hypothetical protein [Ktedonobacteraceae bacterium]